MLDPYGMDDSLLDGWTMSMFSTEEGIEAYAGGVVKQERLARQQS